MKLKTAIYKTDYSDAVAIIGDWADKYSGYVRLTEFVDVDFPDLDTPTVLANEIAALEAEIEEVQKGAIEKISNLNAKKQELLALTHQQ